ncbi:hypothetical protein AALP_AA5G034500 [Arabis alpina]|uniref:Ubiquitin-conjugating enzyme E2C-binding protein n=1 Tax=Arabis alpina TaxID=50452 RepID=A0A087GUP4_ARAAL|nr:hypothetical protein AALP_AA5G034500 [Arabis alpina]
MEQQNPKTLRKWRYTWEAQSHSPNLRLFLFDSKTNPKTHCKSLNVTTLLGKSHLLLTWIDDKASASSLHVPIPKVLLDTDSPINFKALDDHIEVKLVLLLPIDHPLVISDFDLVGVREKSTPLVMGYDLKSLSSMKGVYFHCRNCSTRLTKKALLDFSEMPSINWRESADNWFGTCCCSFGGISEKMVAKYTNSYTCSSGMCLLSATTVLLSKDDLIEFVSSGGDGIEERFVSSLALSCDLGGVESGSRGESIRGQVDDSMRKAAMSECCVHDAPDSSESLKLNQQFEFVSSGRNGIENQFESSSTLSSDCGGAESSYRSSEGYENGGESIRGLACGEVDGSSKAMMNECCVHDSPDSSESLRLEQQLLTLDKKFLLDGFLEDVFMAKASNVSKNVEWIEYVCSECSSPLGAYPSSGGLNSDKPIDGGVRLFKCCISTSSVSSESSDVFRKYTLERMFTNQLVECAKEELSFHVLVKDLTTKLPLFQIVILNPNTWSWTGLCSSQDEPGSMLELSPVVKVLFSDCNSSVVKKIDEEVYILNGQGEELIELLTNASKFLPSSCSFLQGSLVSSMHL